MTPASDTITTGIVASLHHELGINITMSLGGKIAAENLLIAAVLTNAAGFWARLHHRGGVASGFCPITKYVFTRGVGLCECVRNANTRGKYVFTRG